MIGEKSAARAHRTRVALICYRNSMAKRFANAARVRASNVSGTSATIVCQGRWRLWRRECGCCTHFVARKPGPRAKFRAQLLRSCHSERKVCSATVASLSTLETETPFEASRHTPTLCGSCDLVESRPWSRFSFHSHFRIRGSHPCELSRGKTDSPSECIVAILTHTYFPLAQ